MGLNYKARERLIEFFETNYDKIFQRFSKSMGALGTSVNNMISNVNDMKRINQLETFFQTKDTREYTRSLNGGLEKAKVNAAQIQRELPELLKWAH